MCCGLGDEKDEPAAQNDEVRCGECGSTFPWFDAMALSFDLLSPIYGLADERHSSKRCIASVGDCERMVGVVPKWRYLVLNVWHHQMGLLWFNFHNTKLIADAGIV